MPPWGLIKGEEEEYNNSLTVLFLYKLQYNHSLTVLFLYKLQYNNILTVLFL